MPPPPLLADPIGEAAGHLRAGRLADAARLFRAVLGADPTNVEALTGLAEEALLRRSYDAARPLLARAATVSPRNAGSFALMAQLHAAEQRLEEADSCILTAIALAPRALRYRIQRALLRATGGAAGAALAELRDLAAAWPPDPDLLSATATLELSLGLAIAAKDRLQQAVALDRGARNAGLVWVVADPIGGEAGRDAASASRAGVGADGRRHGAGSGGAAARRGRRRVRRTTGP